VTGWPVITVGATPPTIHLGLRGARQTEWNGRHLAIAWGRLPADGSGTAVAFACGRLWRAIVSPQVIELARHGAGWPPLMARYDRVMVTAPRFCSASPATSTPSATPTRPGREHRRDIAAALPHGSADTEPLIMRRTVIRMR
jgi:hypothetical protein